MIQNPARIISGFIEALAKAYGTHLAATDITHELLRAPHDYPHLPKGKCAIYVFSLHNSSLASAGPNRVLKVGKAGPKTIARFKYQHYSAGSARSTLAGAIKNNRVLWNYIGYGNELSPSDPGLWLKANTDRDHFFLSVQKQLVLPFLEAYVRGLLGPVYEGSLKGD